MKINAINTQNQILYKDFNINAVNNLMLNSGQKDEFIASKRKKSRAPFILIPLIGAVGIAILTLSRQNKTDELKKIAKKLDIDFPKDAIYKKRLLKSMGLRKNEAYKLTSIMGEEEFTETIKKLSKDPEIYSSGEKIYDSSGKVIGFDFENVKNFKFGANLHVHTTYSDGRLSVEKLLENVSNYADERYEKTKKPFILAITDHDGIEGNKKALREIAKNPNKYKNIRLVLGIEHTAIYNSPNLPNSFGHIHILSHCINPWDDGYKKLFDEKIQKNLQNIKNSIDFITSKFQHNLAKYNFKYSLDEMLLMAPSLKYSPRSATYYTKDYLQFRLIYNEIVENNPKLRKALKENRIKISKFNYTNPISFIPKKINLSDGKYYYDLYYDAIKKFFASELTNKNPNLSEKEINKLFKPIEFNSRILLNHLESEALNKSPKSYIQPINFISFEETIKTISNNDFGTICFAHPGVIFPISNSSNQDKLPALYRELFEKTTQLAPNKPIAAERFYQSYYKDDKEQILNEIFKIAEEFKFLKTGGLDTHSTDFYSI